MSEKMAPEREIALLKRRLAMTNKYWLRAAKEALAGDDRKLRSRVTAMEAPPLELVLSESDSKALEATDHE